MDYSELTRGILSVEIRGLIFFALALAVIFFLRKRSARVVATCWRSVFAAATVMVLLGFAKPMLVMEMLGHRDSIQKEKITAVVIPGTVPVESPTVTAHSEMKLAPSNQIAEPQTPTASSPDEKLSISWPVLMLVVWILGMIVLLMRPLFGLIGLVNLYRQSESGSAPMMEKFHIVCQRAGVRGLKLRELQTADGIPFVAGILRPTLFVPASACDWERADWEIILRHEVAHVRHFDGFFNFLAQLCLAAYWVNPFVWIAYRKLKISQECAADDAVLSAGIGADEYAGALLKFCAKSVSVPAMAMPMARPSTMRVRIKRILDTNCRRAADRAESRIGGLAIVFLAAVLGTTALVRAEKAANQALVTWTLEHFVDAFIESQAGAKVQPRQGNLIIGRDTKGRIYNPWSGKLSLSWLEGILENDVYLSGPHKNGKFNLESRTSFGHYNPAALDEIAIVLDGVLADKDFVEAFQPSYDKYLRKPACIYLDVFEKQQRKINENPGAFEALRVNYEAWIAAGQTYDFDASLGRRIDAPIADAISSFEDNVWRNGAVDWYEAAFASKFWSRRMLDGTDVQFLDLLAKIMTVMDPNGPISNVSDKLDIKADVTPLKNAFSIDLKAENLSTYRVEAWSRIDGGPWVKGSYRDYVLEGSCQVEWQFRVKELPIIKSQTEKAEINIEGSLRPLINQAVKELVSEEFSLRSKARKILDRLDVQAKPLLEELYEKSTDKEQRAQLKQVIKAISN